MAPLRAGRENRGRYHSPILAALATDRGPHAEKGLRASLPPGEQKLPRCSAISIHLTNKLIFTRLGLIRLQAISGFCALASARRCIIGLAFPSTHNFAQQDPTRPQPSTPHFARALRAVFLPLILAASD